MAGVFAPPKKHRMGSGGGSGKGSSAGGSMLGMAVASMFPNAASRSAGSGARAQTKRAFGGGSHAALSRRAVSTMERTARRVPEVMVRITGRQHGRGHVLANFSYISRLGHGAEQELELQTSEGDVIRSGKEMQTLARDWHEWEMDGDARRKGATSMSMILSMPAGTDPEKLKEAALDFAKVEMANRSWVASLHVDRDHPHVHLTFARRDHDGRRFHPNRDDLFRYRQRFAEKLRDRGIEANATPAVARSIDPKHEPIAAMKVREKGQLSTVDRNRSARIAKLRDLATADPVAAVLSKQQALVRAAYERSIKELSLSPSLADQLIVKSLERFITSLPAPEPNSVRVSGMVTGAKGEIERKLVADRGGGNASADPDQLAAALARSGAMHEQLDANRGAPEVPGRSKTEETGERPSGISDRLRSLMEDAEKQSAYPVPSKADEIRRQTQERDRAQRDRDRTPDRDGPRR
jgi:hypothetical protein